MEKNFYESIYSLSDPNLIDNLLSFLKAPFADDLLEKEESDAFLEESYEIADKAVPTQKSPVGLAIAYLKSIPTLSLDAHPFWHNREIPLRRIRTAEPKKEASSKTEKKAGIRVYNLCLETDLEESQIRAWWDAKAIEQDHIKSEKDLRVHLQYSAYKVAFEKPFLKQISKWKEKDRKLYKHILHLMREVERRPFIGGEVKTEALKNLKGVAAKRITHKHRLVYCLKEGTVRFIACEGHYEDH